MDSRLHKLPRVRPGFYTSTPGLLPTELMGWFNLNSIYFACPLSTNVVERSIYACEERLNSSLAPLKYSSGAKHLFSVHIYLTYSDNDIIRPSF